MIGYQYDMIKSWIMIGYDNDKINIYFIISCVWCILDITLTLNEQRHKFHIIVFVSKIGEKINR